MGFNSVMNKAFFLFFVFLFIGCKDSLKKNDVNFSGKLNTISVIIDDDLWNGEVGDSLRNKFASPVLGLPQEEPLFSLNQYPVKLLEGFKSNSKNVIIIKKIAKSEFKIEQSSPSNPQNIVHFSGKSVQELLDSIQVHSSDIIKSIKISEIQRYQKVLRLLPKAADRKSTRLNFSHPSISRMPSSA